MPEIMKTQEKEIRRGGEKTELLISTAYSKKKGTGGGGIDLTTLKSCIIIKLKVKERGDNAARERETTKDEGTGGP